MNNGGWGIFRPIAEREDLLAIPNWPYAELARAWGGRGYVASTVAEFRDALADAEQRAELRPHRDARRSARPLARQQEVHPGVGAESWHHAERPAPSARGESATSRALPAWMVGPRVLPKIRIIYESGEPEQRHRVRGLGAVPPRRRAGLDPRRPARARRPPRARLRRQVRLHHLSRHREGRRAESLAQHREGRGRARHAPRAHHALAARLSGDRQGRHHDRDSEVHDQPGVRQSLGVLDAGAMLPPSCREALACELAADYFRGPRPLRRRRPRRGPRCSPPEPDVFNAFALTPLDAGEGRAARTGPVSRRRQAHGLCFSVRPGVAPPPSLGNVFKELALDVPGFTRPSHGPLARMGAAGRPAAERRPHGGRRTSPNSHAERGWERFTDAAIARGRPRPGRTPCSCSGGTPRGRRRRSIDRDRHTVIEGAHPSPLSYRLFAGLATVLARERGAHRARPDADRLAAGR